MNADGCRTSSWMLGPYMDGELDASKLIELDEHVTVCESCREHVRLLRAMRGSLQQVVKTDVTEGFAERVANAMSAERVRAAATAAGAETSGRMKAWQAVPIAAAAAVALAWVSTRGHAMQKAETQPRVGVGEDLLAELVADHSQPLPPDETSAQRVSGLVERYVGVTPVRPASFERGGAHLLGARVIPFRSERAAMLQYVLGAGDDARRISVYVYDPRKMPEDMVANLVPREIGTTEVRVGREKGYSVAATQRAGVGYLLASDLDPDRSAQFVAMVSDDH